MDQQTYKWLVILAAAAILGGGCDRAKTVENSCEPKCEQRCEGDDGCGGRCTCDDPTPPADECGGTCAPNEACVGRQCICTPLCNGRACLPDGCGGTCECPDDFVQNADGEWVPPLDCHDECAAAAWQCGSLCGQTCGGSCGEGAVCELGRCVADFCEREPCNENVSCSDCALSLRLIDKVVKNGRLLEVTVAVEFAPGADDPLPRVADFRIGANHDIQLLSLAPGDAVTQAGKEFFVDAATGQSWRRRGDGSYQMLIFTVGNTNDITSGRLATLRFAVGSDKPVALRLLRRVQTLAPALADTALQRTKYDQGLLVTP
jgi:hypothetical protein